MVYTAPKISEEVWKMHQELLNLLNQRIDNAEVAADLRNRRLKEMICPTTPTT